MRVSARAIQGMKRAYEQTLPSTCKLYTLISSDSATGKVETVTEVLSTSFKCRVDPKHTKEDSLGGADYRPDMVIISISLDAVESGPEFRPNLNSVIRVTDLSNQVFDYLVEAIYPNRAGEFETDMKVEASLKGQVIL